MIPYDVDPSLHSTPHEPLLDDGFSPPGKDEERAAPRPLVEPALEHVLPEKSDF